MFDLPVSDSVQACVVHHFVQIGFYRKFDIQLGAAFPEFDKYLLYKVFGLVRIAIRQGSSIVAKWCVESSENRIINGFVSAAQGCGFVFQKSLFSCYKRFGGLGFRVWRFGGSGFGYFPLKARGGFGGSGLKHLRTRIPLLRD